MVNQKYANATKILHQNFKAETSSSRGLPNPNLKLPADSLRKLYCINNILTPQHPTPLIKSIIKEITSALDRKTFPPLSVA
jgi:hypothetical protein